MSLNKELIEKCFRADHQAYPTRMKMKFPELRIVKGNNWFITQYRAAWEQMN